VAGELPTLTARASAGLLADNFLDVAHFPFVHAGTFGADEAAEVPHYAVARDGWSFTMAYEHPFANREDPAVAAGRRPLVQTRRLTYRLDVPFHLQLRIDFLEAGGSNVIGFFIQPETADSCRLFTTLWRDDLDGDRARLAAAVDFEVAVLREDLRIQEAYHDLVLPLAPTAEVHTRADRATLELRRVLADLVAVAGGAA
jgi:vanillate O-demethylase monooxygenase subunit